MGPTTHQEEGQATASQLLSRSAGRGGSLLCRLILHRGPPPTLKAAAQPTSRAETLTCFGCVYAEVQKHQRSAMNEHVPIGKAQLQILHRPLSSLVQEGRKEKQKNRNKNKGRREEERETEYAWEEGAENRGEGGDVRRRRGR